MTISYWVPQSHPQTEETLVKGESWPPEKVQSIQIVIVVGTGVFDLMEGQSTSMLLCLNRRHRVQQ